MIVIKKSLNDKKTAFYLHLNRLFVGISMIFNGTNLINFKGALISLCKTIDDRVRFKLMYMETCDSFSETMK